MHTKRTSFTDSDWDLVLQVYKKYYGNMKRAVLELVSGSDVEDIVQNTVIRMIDSLNNWKNLSETQMYVYTYKAARHNAINYLRSHKHKTIIPLEQIHETSHDDFCIDSQLIKEENIHELYHILNHMSDRDRNLLIMKYIDRLSDSQIAELLSTKQDSVRSLLSRARKHVLEIAKQEGLLYER